MKITGYWTGSYQQTRPPEEESLPLRIRLERSWWGAVRGTVYFGEEEEQGRGKPIRGWQHFRGLSFSVDVAALNKQRAQARIGAATAVSAQPPSSSSAGIDSPSHFWANRIVDVNELAGEWKFLVWMMVGEKRKIVQVGISEGTWSVHRVRESGV